MYMPLLFSPFSSLSASWLLCFVNISSLGSTQAGTLAISIHMIHWDMWSVETTHVVREQMSVKADNE